MNPIVKDREIRGNGAKGRSHQECRVWIILGNFACRAFKSENFADDQLHALFGKLAHDALVVRIRNIFRERVFDIAAFRRSIQRLVDAADPLLLDRQGVNRGNLQFFCRCHTGGQ